MPVGVVGHRQRFGDRLAIDRRRVTARKLARGDDAERPEQIGVPTLEEGGREAGQQPQVEEVHGGRFGGGQLGSFPASRMSRGLSRPKASPAKLPKRAATWRPADASAVSTSAEV